MVKKSLVKWKSVACTSRDGSPVLLEIPSTIDDHYHGNLLLKISQMKKMTAITFEAAINLVSENQKEAFVIGNIGKEPGQYLWFSHNFIEFISSQGFHIELTGDEFVSVNDLAA